MARDPSEADVHLPFLQFGLDLGQRDFQNTEIDPRMFLLKRPSKAVPGELIAAIALLRLLFADGSK